MTADSAGVGLECLVALGATVEVLPPTLFRAEQRVDLRVQVAGSPPHRAYVWREPGGLRASSYNAWGDSPQYCNVGEELLALLPEGVRRACAALR